MMTHRTSTKHHERKQPKKTHTPPSRTRYKKRRGKDKRRTSKKSDLEKIHGIGGAGSLLSIWSQTMCVVLKLFNIFKYLGSVLRRSYDGRGYKDRNDKDKETIWTAIRTHVRWYTCEKTSVCIWICGYYNRSASSLKQRTRWSKLTKSPSEKTDPCNLHCRVVCWGWSKVSPLKFKQFHPPSPFPI